ncbi:hypothetical protein BJ165DRAFT_1529459 [Panaeolus papilionaceus]|nr:hypothetical protein BJ165DRAFT_1529459 [Panaeolus papilionaceus]
MATTSKMEYKKIKVTGPVSVERVDRVNILRRECAVLIMGPTGAGKSSFIEALGLKLSAMISSNGLDGCTQAISTYKLINVTDLYDDPFYLVDSPGFADTKISEMAIVSMLQKWLKDNRLFNRILYLTPISSTRLPGTQQQVLKTFHALTGVKTAKNVTIVTTMWDNIWGEHATKRAEDNYQQLQNNIWTDFIEEGAQMVQFHNTQESALSILDAAFASITGYQFSIEDHDDNIKGSPFEANLLTDLQDRIQNLQSHILTFHDELAHAKAQGDQLLLSTLCPRLQEAETDLARFQKELDSSGLLPPPLTPLATPPPDSEPHGTTLQANGTTHVQQSENQVFVPCQDPEPALHGQPEVRPNNTPDFASSTSPLSLPPLVTQIETVPDAASVPGVVTLFVPPSDSEKHVLPTHDIATAGISRSIEEDVRAELQQPNPVRHTPGRFARIMQLMKCWGDAVGEHHDA